MGRRSINTTKSGKYMNPTDQARKEARKKELKKNKRQRQMVRAAVLKNKDPGQILEEMEKIDEMEYNVMQPSPLNEKVLRDKRKKLKETFDRVMRLYHTDEPEHWAELKRKEVEYEKKRLKKQQYYESVKHAQSVQIDDIPLPSSTPTAPVVASGGASFPNRLPPPPSSLSLPPFAPSAPPSALKKINDNTTKSVLEKSVDSIKKKEIPSVPPGPPPDLQELPELDTDAEDDEVVLKEYNPKAKSLKTKSVHKPNSLQQRMLAISGQNIDEFMKEMENVHKKKERERQAAQELNSDDNGEPKGRTKTAHKSEESEEEDKSDSDTDSSEKSDSSSQSLHRKYTSMQTAAKATESLAPKLANNMPLLPAPMPLQMPALPMPPVSGLAPPPPMVFRPPPLRPPGGMHNFGMRMPPGPPPRQPGLSGMTPRMGIRMPPGPPPGLPPRMAHHHKHSQQQQLHAKDLGKGVTTITAKPQIRNLSADVTRFVPSTLRVKREEMRRPNRMKPYAQDTSQIVGESNKAATKDDAYLQFMNEMQGLL